MTDLVLDLQHTLDTPTVPCGSILNPIYAWVVLSTTPGVVAGMDLNKIVTNTDDQGTTELIQLYGLKNMVNQLNLILETIPFIKLRKPTIPSFRAKNWDTVHVDAAVVYGLYSALRLACDNEASQVREWLKTGTSPKFGFDDKESGVLTGTGLMNGGLVFHLVHMNPISGLHVLTTRTEQPLTDEENNEWCEAVKKGTTSQFTEHKFIHNLRLFRKLVEGK